MEKENRRTKSLLLGRRLTVCGICDKKGHKDKKCFEKAEMTDERPVNWESCLTEEKMNELGLTSIYCPEIENGGKNNIRDYIGILGAEFYYIIISRTT